MALCSRIIEAKAYVVLQVEEVFYILFFGEIVSIQPYRATSESFGFILRRDTSEGNEINIIPFRATLEYTVGNEKPLFLQH